MEKHTHTGTADQRIRSTDRELIAVNLQISPRYQWKRINFSRFLYDRIDDLYIPEVVYKALCK